MEHTFSALGTYFQPLELTISALGILLCGKCSSFRIEKKSNKQRRRVAKADGNVTKLRDYLKTVWELEVKGWEKENVEDKQGAKIEAVGGGRTKGGGLV